MVCAGGQAESIVAWGLLFPVCRTSIGFFKDVVCCDVAWRSVNGIFNNHDKITK